MARGRRYRAVLFFVAAISVAAQSALCREQIEITRSDETPSLELLEFLGEWETEEGEWIDPEEIAMVDIAEVKEKNDEPK